MLKFLNFIKDISILKTIYFNFYYFDFKTAIKFPVFVSNNIILKTLSRKVMLSKNLKMGDIRLGFESIGIFDKKRSKGIWEMKGTINFSGRAFIGQETKIFTDENAELLIGKEFSLTGETQIICQKENSIWRQLFDNLG